MERDASYDGLFYAAVTTTGIFCRPSCPARKAKPDNVEYFPSAREALFAGFRPCSRCRPLDGGNGGVGDAPSWVRSPIDRVEADPKQRITDADLRNAGIDPASARRWFLRTFGMTFQAYCRSRRLGAAFRSIRGDGDIDGAAFDHGWESLSAFRDAFSAAVGIPPGAAKTADVVSLAWIETPIGPMVAGATDSAICLLEFTDRRMMEKQLRTVAARLGRPLIPAENFLVDRLRLQLGEYFAGTRRSFDLPLDYPGTVFQRRVWEGLLRIPYGETRSYARLAEEIGAEGASRAVGTANGMNRIAILIPCHRVIAADGGLGGYGGGLWRKLRLLETEGAAAVQSLRQAQRS